MKLNSLQPRSWLKILLTLPLIYFLGSCSGKDSSTTTSNNSTFTNIYNDILNQSCVSCHAPGGSAYDNDNVQLDFSSKSQAYTTLTTKHATGNSSTGTCGSVEIVGDSPEESYLAGVLFSDYNINDFAGVSGCTPYSVHLSDTNLSSAEENTIVLWINAGAQNN